MLVRRNPYTVQASLTFDPVWMGKKIIFGAVGGIVGSFVGQGIGSILSRGCGTAQAGKTLKAASAGDTEELVKRANYIKVCQETSKENWGFRGMVVGFFLGAFPLETLSVIGWTGKKLVSASHTIKEWTGPSINDAAHKLPGTLGDNLKPSTGTASAFPGKPLADFGNTVSALTTGVAQVSDETDIVGQVRKLAGRGVLCLNPE